MKKKDLILALLVVIVWGANFTVIKLGLSGVPPMLLAALRYLCVIPAIFFVKRPQISLRDMLLYGFSVGVGQFSCLFYAMKIGMPAGLSSILLQSAAFMTPLAAFVMLNEKIKSRQIVGLVIALIGLCFIATSALDGIGGVSFLSLFLTLLAAGFWAISNIIIKSASNKIEANGEKLDMMGVVVWSSLIPPIPLLAMAIIMDSPRTILDAIYTLNPIAIFSILYLALGATIFGYGMWSILLGKYPASKISPLSLMVPVTGLISARIVLGENLSSLQWIGGIIIFLGLAVSVLDTKKRFISQGFNKVS